jgi:hypothetical protein
MAKSEHEQACKFAEAHCKKGKFNKKKFVQLFNELGYRNSDETEEMIDWAFHLMSGLPKLIHPDF